MYQSYTENRDILSLIPCFRKSCLGKTW